jgi:hypothetical protein
MRVGSRVSDIFMEGHGGVVWQTFETKNMEKCTFNASMGVLILEIVRSSQFVTTSKNFFKLFTVKKFKISKIPS